MMNRIGYVIKEYRSMLHMSRKELSNNICSEKYLYMIERGERTPASEITRLLGDKMGVDLFQYHPYLDCSDPIQTCYFIDKFYQLRRENDLNSLAEVTQAAQNIQDFSKEPWIYEVELNHLIVQVLAKGDYVNSIPLIKKTIILMEQRKFFDICLAGYYVLLSTCYQMARDLKSAREVVMRVNKAIEGKEKIARYVQIIQAVKLNKITLHYLEGEFAAAIEDSLKLVQYQNEMCCQAYLYHTLFYLAFAHYQSGMEEEGIVWFNKALSMMIIHHREMDMDCQQ